MRSQQSRVILPRAFLMCWMLSRWRDCEKKSSLLSSSVLVWLTDSWLTQRQKQMSGLIQYDSWFPIVEEISDLYRFLEFPRHRVFLHRLSTTLPFTRQLTPISNSPPMNITIPTSSHTLVIPHHHSIRPDPFTLSPSPSQITSFTLVPNSFHTSQDTMLPSSTMPAQHRFIL